MQIGKLLALAPVNAPGRASNVTTLKDKVPPYHLMHSMTWDEDGELDIR